MQPAPHVNWWPTPAASVAEMAFRPGALQPLRLVLVTTLGPSSGGCYAVTSSDSSRSQCEHGMACPAIVPACRQS